MNVVTSYYLLKSTHHFYYINTKLAYYLAIVSHPQGQNLQLNGSPQNIWLVLFNALNREKQWETVPALMQGHKRCHRRQKEDQGRAGMELSDRVVELFTGKFLSSRFDLQKGVRRKRYSSSMQNKTKLG